AGAAVDEDELRPEDETLALHVGAHRHDAPAAETVEGLLIALHEAGRRAVGEEHRAGDDQGILEFLADPLPVRGVGEQPLVRLEILLVLDIGGRRPAPPRPVAVARSPAPRGAARPTRAPRVSRAA